MPVSFLEFWGSPILFNLQVYGELIQFQKILKIIGIDGYRMERIPSKLLNYQLLVRMNVDLVLKKGEVRL